MWVAIKTVFSGAKCNSTVFHLSEVIKSNMHVIDVGPLLVEPGPFKDAIQMLLLGAHLVDMDPLLNRLAHLFDSMVDEEHVDFDERYPEEIRDRIEAARSKYLEQNYPTKTNSYQMSI